MAGVSGDNTGFQYARQGGGGHVAGGSQSGRAMILKKAQYVFWGGYSSYFADPDKFLWEVAWSLGFSMAADGSIQLPD